jgi:hypothetical protein
MNNVVSDRTRSLLIQSLPAVESKEDVIRDALSASLTRSEQDPELSAESELIAALLLNFLIRQARQVAEGGAPVGLELYENEHRLHGISGRHYSRFGDALIPVLRDALGAMHPRATALAWGDAFWAFVRRMQDDAECPLQANARRTVAEAAA